MLKMSESQYAGLLLYSDDVFAKQIAKDVRDNHAESCNLMSDKSLLDVVKSGMKKSRSYGLTTKYAISMFIELMFIIHPTYDENDLVSHCLTEPTITADGRMDHLLHTLTDSDWDAVKQDMSKS